MLILFVIIYILSAQLIYNCNNNLNTGVFPYSKLSLDIICIFYHIILLVMSIYYMGWLWGIILFLCHFFAVIHMTIGWTLNIPVLILNHRNNVLDSLHLIKLNYIFISPMLIISLIFTVVSFFVADFKSMFDYLSNNTNILIPVGIVAVLLGLIRIIISKKYA